MKYLIFLLAITFLYTQDAKAQRFQRTTAPSKNLSCIWQSTIGTSGKLCYRQDGEVYVKPKARQAIKSIELIISGKTMGKDTNYPFVWKINPKAKGLYAGRHRTTAKIMDMCGKEHLVHKILEVRKCPVQ